MEKLNVLKAYMANFYLSQNNPSIGKGKKQMSFVNLLLACTTGVIFSL